MVFVGKKDQQNAKERFQGLTEALKDSKINVIDLRADDGDRRLVAAGLDAQHQGSLVDVHRQASGHRSRRRPLSLRQETGITRR